jgi:predicted Zn finger-like uncharacterized protein
MEISCNNCKGRFNIPAEKLPEGKVASIRCPKCKNKIVIDLTNEGPVSSEREPPPPRTQGFDFDEGMDDNEYNPDERPFDFLEEEGKTAIICEKDPTIVKAITTVLDIMEYSVTVAESMRDALRKMKYHTYDMVLINETFDAPDPESNGILIYMERLQMDVRRNIFVGLLTRRYATMDNMAAFLKSVNITINLGDIDKIDRILGRGISEFEMFYAIYKDSAKKLGVA